MIVVNMFVNMGLRPSVNLGEGIPDFTVEYLTKRLKFARNYSKNNELMHKKDVDIVPQLRKKYRFYIGQGIPNPWTPYSYVDDSEILTSGDFENSRKYLYYLPHSKRLNRNLKKELCFCCKKRYIFECPDKCYTDSRFCSCKSCRGNSTTATDSSKKCRCIEILQKWVLKNAVLKQKKKQAQKESSETGLTSPNGSDSGEDDEVQNLNEESKCVQCCEHLKSEKACSGDNPSDKSTDEKPFQPKNRSNFQAKKQCFCPYKKNVCLRRIPLKINATKNSSEFVTSASKLVQAELQPKKFSKTVQTENSETKAQPKCDCNNKCLQCNMYRYKTPWIKSGCPIVHSVSNLCFPYGCPQNTAFVCPCFFSSNCILHKFCKHEFKTQKEQSKKKQHKEKETEEDSNADVRRNQHHSNADKNNSGIKCDAKCDFGEQKATKTSDEDLKSKTNMYYLPPMSKTVDHLKILIDEKLKSNTQPEEISSSALSHQFSHSGSRLLNFSKGDASFYSLRPTRVQYEKMSAPCNYIPRHSESSFVESKMNIRENNLRNSNFRRVNCSDQATMTKTPKNDVLTKVRFFKELVESDESRTFGLTAKNDLGTKAMKKRRRLLANRKRRKKLSASGKVSFLEYQAFLDRLPKGPALVNKHVQVEQNALDNQNMKKAGLFTSDALNSSENNFLRFKNATFSSGRNIGDWKRIYKEISSQTCKFMGSVTSEETLKQPLCSELQFGGVFEKVSCNSGSSWSSNALKNFMDDLIMEKKYQKQN